MAYSGPPARHLGTSPSLPAAPIQWTEASSRVSHATLGCHRGYSLGAYGADSLRSSSPGYKAKNALYPLFFVFLFQLFMQKKSSTSIIPWAGPPVKLRVLFRRNIVLFPVPKIAASIVVRYLLFVEIGRLNKATC